MILVLFLVLSLSLIFGLAVSAQSYENAQDGKSCPLEQHVAASASSTSTPTVSPGSKAPKSGEIQSQVWLTPCPGPTPCPSPSPDIVVVDELDYAPKACQYEDIPKGISCLLDVIWSFIHNVLPPLAGW
ncbi:hypothetical protein BO71DRAFT_413762 [Aspergillus ellipticus CBS 707.79]|uniref:Uncharacterized protein n=1 Tax=Aspergillus ellipticus CBS 707.79 TaxID=1448320 RepID=A0A319CW67_9EURO|nr:hypothetical protein BO71DRAFT_413762 [Aspergillus ellipticus CBS 707.79]